jgi:ketosteroid isomerase-like protein
MAEHANCDLIRRLYAARARDDREEVRAILHDDVRWHDPYPPPHGGDLVGAEAVIGGVIERAGELTGGIPGGSGGVRRLLRRRDRWVSTMTCCAATSRG